MQCMWLFIFYSHTMIFKSVFWCWLNCEMYFHKSIYNTLNTTNFSVYYLTFTCFL